MLIALPAMAQSLDLKEPVVVNGDNVEYFHERKMVVGTGNISIVYKDVTLTCDKVTVYLDTKEAIAEGNVKIIQEGAYLTGEKINYNFEKKTGSIIDAYVNATPFYGKAGEGNKTSDTEIELKKGYVTTCDLEHPHYRVQARQVTIYLEDRVVAKHIIFYIGKVPVFYFPYYIQPLKDTTAHATVLLGRESRWGYYALTSFKYAFSDIAKGRVRIDYRTKKGLAQGIDNYYDTKKIGSGYVKFYQTYENNFTYYNEGDDDEKKIIKSKYSVQWRHRWNITDDTLALVEFNKVRDKDFLKDYFYNEYEEQGDPDNYISVITSKRDYTASLLIRKRMDDYFDVVERLPEYTIDIPNYNFKNTRFYYKG
ncbi:MAG: LptA/OstA family protein, partial [Candidatus Omnitrophica bacterium]|nr:LptA/OstA family protein [Candidatus Omnitrophota bacterium]